MTGAGFKTGQWPRSLGGGISDGGPLVVFTPDTRTSVVMSPLSNFMAASLSTKNSSRLDFGVMGSVTSIPAGYSVEFIFHVSSGINLAFESWGNVLLNRYGKSRTGVDYDYMLTNLGYSTDNGAYYYYLTEPGKDYQDTLIGVKQYADSVDIPYKYILLDSWWYFKGIADGVSLWDAMPSIFPSGLDYMWNTTGWPVQGHNRYWAPDNLYAKQNGGKWEFIIERNDTRPDGTKKIPMGLPAEQGFWDWLLPWARHWGLITYEQDWLDTTFDNLDAMAESATLGRTWLMQMGTAARRAGLTIQYCMSHTRHILQSVEIPAVTNARASGDYGANAYDQWSQLGTTGIFAHSVGIAPSKDNYWSKTVQPGNKWGPSRQEPLHRLQSVVSTLSRGPVAPSDRIGYSDPDLILRACTSGGKLLRPDRPATNIDSHYTRACLDTPGPAGELWTTHTTISGQRFYYVLATEMREDYTLTAAELKANGSFVAFETNTTSTVEVFDGSHPLRLKACNALDFQYYSVSPRFDGWSLIGEQNKWISAAPERFSSLTMAGGNVTVVVTGDPGETVHVSFLGPDRSVHVVSCTVPTGSSYRISMPAMSCEAI